MTWHAALGRFVMANVGLIDDDGEPRPWHQQPRMSPHHTQLTMFEVAAPWGPWSHFYRDDDSQQAPGLYTPAACHQPLVSNQTSMLLISSWLDGAPNCRYTLNWQAEAMTVEAAAKGRGLVRRWRQLKQRVGSGTASQEFGSGTASQTVGPGRGSRRTAVG